jgi:hypothetical protein
MCPGRQRSWRSISLSCYRHQHLPASLELSRHQFVLLSFPPLLFLLSQCCLRYLLATSAVYVPTFGLPFSRFLFADFLSLSVVLCHFSWLPRFALSSLACSLIVSCSSVLCPSFFLCHLLVAVIVYNFVIGLAFCRVLFSDSLSLRVVFRHFIVTVVVYISTTSRGRFLRMLVL